MIIHVRGDFMSFNEKLQKLRKDNKLSQEDLADKLGVTRQSISKWESGITYPEMDKLLALCKIFNCTLDEITNDEITISDFDKDEKKNNLNTLVDSTLDIINRTYYYFTHINFKEFLKCFIIMVIVVILLSIVKQPINNLEYSILEMLQSLGKPALANFVYHLFSIVIDIAYYILCVLLFVYIFKIGFLDHVKYEPKEDNNSSNLDNNSKKEIDVPNDSYTKISNHSNSFFHALGLIILTFIKIILVCLALPLVLSLIFLCFCLAIDVSLIFKGVYYFSIFFLIIFSICFNSLILEFMFNIIFNKKHPYKRMLLTFLVCVAGFGISCGIFAIELNNINYVNKVPSGVKTVTTDYTYKYNNNLLIDSIYDTTYVVDNTLKNDVKVEITCFPKYNNVYPELSEADNYINIINNNESFKLSSITDLIITDLKKKELHNYDKLTDVKITIISSENNINTLKNNNYYNTEASSSSNYEKRISDLESQNSEYTNRINELEAENSDLKQKITDYTNKIKSLLD